MKVLKIVIGVILISGPLLTISRYNGEPVAELIVPFVVLLIGIWLIKSGLTSKKEL